MLPHISPCERVHADTQPWCVLSDGQLVCRQTAQVRDGAVYFAFTKIGKYMLGPPEELWVMKSPNMLTAADAADITWELLPEGDVGITPPGGHRPNEPNLEEAHVLPLTGVGAPGFYIAGRSTLGWLVASSTADATARQGWSPAAFAQYYDPATSSGGDLAPLRTSTTAFGGARAGVKNPRGPVTLKRFDGPSGAAPGRGAYLLLFFNNNAKSYLSRNPYWLAAGHEVPGTAGAPPTVLFSQPEIALYDGNDHTDRPGYPDFIAHSTNTTAAGQGDWDVYITETQKTAARIHKVDRALLRGLFGQRTVRTAAEGAAASLGPGGVGPQGSIPTPAFPAFDHGPGAAGLGFAFSLVLHGHHLSKPGQAIVSSEPAATATATTAAAGGVALVTGPAAGGQVTLRFGDGARSFNISTDAACSAVLGTTGAHFLGAVADGGPQIATLMVDGVLCDGAGLADYGWAWFPAMGAVRGAESMRVGQGYGGAVAAGLVYTRMLTTSEQVGNSRALVSRARTSAASGALGV